MTDFYKPPYGTYSNVAGIIAATPAAQVVTVKNQLKAFLSTANGLPENKPGFDHVSEEAMSLILGEIDGAFAAIAAAPAA